MQKRPKVLFLSIGNSTRSQIAEGFLRALGGDCFETASTGTESTIPNPMAVRVMNEVGVNITRQRSKNVRESLMEHFGYVVSIFDSARERAAIFPFTPNLLRWDLADPSAVQVPEPVRVERFRRLRDEIRAKVQNFIARNGVPLRRTA